VDTVDTNEHKPEYLPEGFLVAGRYEIVRILGAGGMGAVYLAQDRILGGEQVAIKVLHRQYAYEQRYTQRFLREVQLMRRVNDSNVVRTYDVGADQDIVYFTMEFVDGHSLLDVLETNTIRHQDIPNLILQICKGLSAIHEAGIIHRDLKPGNILILDDGTIRITDFGVARPEISELTAHNEVIGSSTYMAPEVWLGENITASVDLYSLGIILYEIVIGEPPFDSDSPASLMRLHLDRQPTPPERVKRDTPAWLNKLIMMLLEKKAVRRPSSAKDVIEFVQTSSAMTEGLKNASSAASASFIKSLEEVSKRAADVNATAVQKRETRRIEREAFSWGFKVPFRASAISKVGAGAALFPEEQGVRTVQRFVAAAFVAITTLFLSAGIESTLGYFFSEPSTSKILSSVQVPRTPDSWSMLFLVGGGHALASLLLLCLPVMALGAASLRMRIFIRSCISIFVFNALAALTLFSYYLFPVLRHSYFDKESVVHASVAVETQLIQLVYLSPFASNWNSVVLDNGLRIEFEGTELINFSSSPLFLLSMCAYLAVVVYIARLTAGVFSKRPFFVYFTVGILTLVLLTIEVNIDHIALLKSMSSFSEIPILGYHLQLPGQMPLPFAYNWFFIFFVTLIVTPVLGGWKLKKKKKRRVW